MLHRACWHFRCLPNLAAGRSAGASGYTYLILLLLLMLMLCGWRGFHPVSLRSRDRYLLLSSFLQLILTRTSTRDYIRRRFTPLCRCLSQNLHCTSSETRCR
ncbi:hypothetical protein B0T09DRAFT_328412 [Sordaria sp. MPI-SDFR-AT-0083]|nr:hypothetical protein B0T09DRAFT_328412 [Sordaria sp. MPI-SDFR-AT-0083]